MLVEMWDLVDGEYTLLGTADKILGFADHSNGEQLIFQLLGDFVCVLADVHDGEAAISAASDK